MHSGLSVCDVFKLMSILPLLFHSGMLSEAVIPPSDEHSYAQWLKQQDPEKSHSKSQGKHVVFLSLWLMLSLFVSFFFFVNLCP